LGFPLREDGLGLFLRYGFECLAFLTTFPILGQHVVDDAVLAVAATL
jgi:hypothetical protein